MSRVSNGNVPLALSIGPFNISITSNEPPLQRSLAILYQDYPLTPPNEFIDFHVDVRRPRGLRSFYHPQVDFYLDDHKPFKPLPANEAYPLLEWGLNWVIASHAHQYFMIHSAVLEKNGRGLILPAPPGSGKSTLCAALTFSGWRLLSDEFALIERESGSMVPFVRPLSLKNDSIRVIGERWPDMQIGSRVEGTAKGTVTHIRPPQSSVGRGTDSCLPAMIVFPKYRAGASTQLEPIGKADAFPLVISNSFNYHSLGTSGFECCARLVNDCDTYRFQYSDLDQALTVFETLADHP